MTSITQFVIRQSGWLTLFSLLFMAVNGGYVFEGLWQGSGLHGYIIDTNAKGGPPYVVSVWSAMLRMLVFFGIAVLFGLIALRREKNHVLKHTATPRRRGKPPLRGIKTKSTRK